ncbi:MAG: DUF2283 domain-containing protein [Candidatus Sumerlaeota bacterium]|nr:DUF2283 domain-containing protein [Candidatus Sumerlaeota bacterium]
MKMYYYADTDSLYMELSSRVSAESEEVSPGVILDFDAAGVLVGLDMDNASRKLDLQELRLHRLMLITETISA